MFHGIKNKRELILFLLLTLIVLAQAIWWIIFMARLTDEKVTIAGQLGADGAFMENIAKQEINRQIMVGLEGVFFLVLILAGAWLIYRALVRAEEHKFQQQNFLMAVTHELKTPLASMKIYLGSLQSPKISDEKKVELIPKIKRDLLRFEKLVGDILEAGRFERSGYRLNKGPMNLTSAVEEVLEQMVTQASEKEIKIDKNLSDDLPYSGDQAALGRALGAVLENSIKYNENRLVQLQIKLETSDKNIVLSVTDNGIGLKASDTKQIFDRFYRVGDEMKRNQPGTGLGLFLAREIFKAHGGEITAASDGLGQGTTITMRLPVNG
ncbi:MAG: HAMP domain-containing histidine kinase [candidate division Zixibacteria bacterium]|nr:HAMP domain-containing histidine kinase [candidate division Zixibacteria bacterium]